MGTGRPLGRCTKGWIDHHLRRNARVWSRRCCNVGYRRHRLGFGQRRLPPLVTAIPTVMTMPRAATVAFVQTTLDLFFLVGFVGLVLLDQIILRCSPKYLVLQSIV